MSRCLGCGAEVDGDVCDYRCEQQAEIYRLEAALKAGRMTLCGDCGEPTPTDQMVGELCEGCDEANRDRANEAEARRLANA